MTGAKWVCGVAAVVFGVGAAAAQPGGRPGGRPSFDALLSAFDANGDGALGRAEVPGRVWARLGAADANGDGTVTRAEFTAY